MKVLLAQTRRWSGSMLTVTTWFVVSFCVAASVLSQPPVTAISYTPDGMQLVVGSEGSLKIIDVVSAEPVGLLGTKLEFVHDARFSRDGKFLAVAGGSPGESGGIEIFLWPEKTLRNAQSDFRRCCLRCQLVRRQPADRCRLSRYSLPADQPGSRQNAAHLDRAFTPRQDHSVPR